MSIICQRTWVGIDWGDATHHVWIVADDGEYLDDFPVAHSALGLAELVERLSRYAPVAGVAIETDRYLLVDKLLSAAFTVYAINPEVSHKWAHCFHVDPATCDARAAAVLAEGLRALHKHFQPLRPDDPLTAELAIRCTDEKDLIDLRTALANKLKACVKAFYPELLDWFSDLTKTTACDFLAAFATPQALRTATANRLRRFLRAHRIGLSPQWQERIASRTDGPTWPADEATVRARSAKALVLAGQIRLLNRQLAGLRKAINELFAGHPDAELFDSLPGLGEKLAPRMLGHLGADRERWPDAQALQVLGGTVPVTRKSGKLKGLELYRWACNKPLRNTLRLWAFTSLRQSVWARAYYERARERGQSHECALRNLAAKWLKILFRAWQDRTPYDERRYLQALERHGSPLIDHIHRSPKCGELMKKLLT